MMRELAKGYTAEIDNIDEENWYRLLDKFDDASIYQTWAYAEVRGGRRNMSQFLLRHANNVAAIALARIVRLPLIKAGIAYIRWGPLYQRRGSETNPETFRQAIRALRNEYACKKGLVLRLFPCLFNEDAKDFVTILEEEGFAQSTFQKGERTILIDLNHPIEDLRAGMRRNWKRNLRVAEEAGLKIAEGSSDELFADFMEVYKETVARKQLRHADHINQYSLIQAKLPERLKMQIMVCKSGEAKSAGLIWSAMGKTGIELFAATSEVGLANKGSYLLRWKLVEKLKEGGFSVYDLNGINPMRNPGGYKFKSELAGKYGKDVYFLGKFDSHTNLASYCCVQLGERLRGIYKALTRENRTGSGRPTTELPIKGVEPNQ